MKSIIVVGHHAYSIRRNDISDQSVTIRDMTLEGEPREDLTPEEFKEAIQEFKEYLRVACQEDDPDNFRCSHTISIDHVFEVGGERLTVGSVDEKVWDLEEEEKEVEEEEELV